jgi:SAM-dependent methyltransferase
MELTLKDKFAEAANEVRNLKIARPSVLDVGCRQRALRRFLLADDVYVGADIARTTEKLEVLANVERGLPFANLSFDVVVALDVLEHLDSMERGLLELFRVARRKLVITLPNIAHVLFRLRFLRDGRIGDKYDVVYGSVADRHRWLTVLPQTDSYLRDFAGRVGAALEVRRYLGPGPKTRHLSRIARKIGIGPSLWAWSSFYVLCRSSAD